MTQKLITVEQFARLPCPSDGSLQELVQGVILTLPEPGGQHGACCRKVGHLIGHFVEAAALGMAAANGTPFILCRAPDTVRAADVAFWDRERLPELPKEFMGVPPDLAVEVLSPADYFSRFQRRIAQYLAHGVRELWVVDPEDRSVAVYRPDQSWRILGESDTLTCEDILPGFSCRVADLFP